MKKLFALIAIFGLLTIGTNNFSFAQAPTEAQETLENNNDSSATAANDSTVKTTEASSQETTTSDETPAEDQGLHPIIKEKYIEGGALFMSFVLISLILGLALAIERIIYLSFADTNTNKLLKEVEQKLETEGVEAAQELCRNKRGPVASIFYQGLSRAEHGLDVVEKTVVSYGSVQMGLLERGLTWISLFIALAPMLGFMGTVIGMIEAFDNIQTAGNVNAGLVAGGIKIALITTVSGLIVAVILQIFYNYIVSKVDNIVSKMEDASISLIDLLTKYQKNN